MAMAAEVLTPGVAGARKGGIGVATAAAPLRGDVASGLGVHQGAPGQGIGEGHHRFERIDLEFGASPDLVALTGPYLYHDLPAWKRWPVFLTWTGAMLLASAATGCMATGGNLVIPKEILLRIGGIDTSIAFYGDDADLARRLSAEGRVKFAATFLIHTSGRRIAGQGFLRTSALYLGNFCSQMLRSAPLTRRYADFR